MRTLNDFKNLENRLRTAQANVYHVLSAVNCDTPHWVLYRWMANTTLANVQAEVEAALDEIVREL